MDKKQTNKQTKKEKNGINNTCFQYVATFALNHEYIEEHSKRIRKVIELNYKNYIIDKYNWQGINHPIHQKAITGKIMRKIT